MTAESTERKLLPTGDNGSSNQKAQKGKYPNPGLFYNHRAGQLHKVKKYQPNAPKGDHEEVSAFRNRCRLGIVKPTWRRHEADEKLGSNVAEKRKQNSPYQTCC